MMLRHQATENVLPDQIIQFIFGVGNENALREMQTNYSVRVNAKGTC